MEGSQNKAVLRAQQVYEKNWGRNVQVRVYFSSRVPVEKYREKDLADGLAEFVRANYQGRFVSCLLERSHPMSRMGVTEIALDVPKAVDTCWFSSAGSGLKFETYDLLAKAISDKNARLADYRRRAERVWLLVGAEDIFTLAGNVGVLRSSIKTWSFESDFDKVLLVSGMYSQVWELNIRRSRA